MPHAHDHDHDSLTADPGVAKILRVVVGVVVVATVIGLIVWWPSGGASLPSGADAQGTRVDAVVVGAEPIECAGSGFGTTAECISVLIDITSGDNSGARGSFEMFPEMESSTPDFALGDEIVVIEFELGDTREVAYTFADFQRDRPLIALTALFVIAVIALGRFQGLRALAGLIVSGVVLFMYIFPALLDGHPPLAVALVGSSVIALAALYLSHGVNDTTTVALLGTFIALALTGVLAAVFSAAAQISGLATEDQIFLLVSAEGIDVRGLVLAGIVLGSLGVLDDVTVTQVSAVARLREANPNYGVRELYSTGIRIGRDHIASTVNTLVLAYAGASLPLLLFYSNVGIGLSESITSEIVAVEVIRTLVGSIGLVAAVPVTTALAALVVTGSTVRRREPPTPARRPTAPAPDPTEPPPDWERFTPTGEDF